MIRAATPFLLLMGAALHAWPAESIVVDFEKGVPLLADGMPTASRDGKKRESCSLSPMNPSIRKGRAC